MARFYGVMSIPHLMTLKRDSAGSWKVLEAWTGGNPATLTTKIAKAREQ